MDMLAEIREVESLSDSSIATTDNRDCEILIKVPITCRAIRYSLPIELHLSWCTELLVLIPSGEDDTLGDICISFAGLDFELIFANLRHCIDTILDECRSCGFRMSFEIVHDLSTWS